MFLKDEEIGARLKSTQGLVDNTTALLPRRANPLTSNFLSMDQRVLIGTMAKIDGVRPVGRQLDMNISQVSNYANGMISKRDPEVNKELKSRVEKNVSDFREKISNLAGSKLQCALENITDDKMKSVEKVKDLAVIAAQLARVTQVAHEDQRTGGSNVQINIFRPRTKDDDEFDVIEVND